MRLSTLLDKEVVTVDGKLVGKIIDVEVDEEWKAKELIVILKRYVASKLGIRFSLRPKVAIAVAAVSGVGEYVTLRIGLDDLHFSVTRKL